MCVIVKRIRSLSSTEKMAACCCDINATLHIGVDFDALRPSAYKSNLMRLIVMCTQTPTVTVYTCTCKDNVLALIH